MTRKGEFKSKVYKGKVISPFTTLKQSYAVGDVFTTANKESYEHLINKNKIQ